MQTCCFPNCQTTVEKNQATCLHHWYLLPPRVRGAVQERIRGWKNLGAAREFIVNWLADCARKEKEQKAGTH